MNQNSHWYLTSIGAKLVMAATGVLLFGFLVGHLTGNLLMFAGPDAMNTYAHWLKERGGLLWGARLGLLVVFAVHIASAIRVNRQNRAARPVAYAVSSFMATSYAARTILVSGIIILAFVVYHLLHYTLGVTNPEYLRMFDVKGRPDVYGMVVSGFSNPTVTGAYIVAMLLLASHLSHGLTSLFQTFGLYGPKFRPFSTKLGPVVAILIFIGFVSIPLAVLSGRLH
ncbi:MAG: succinate dehydrogenase cytochrome b subunit [Nitrospinaceae bacterium]|jgi:succinate dehydrogenase / fumarate reductase, cytochrome b subunit|nr:succinate dehydrogenase cytochrome b subunit [Nitrospinaceae bacterium]MBT3434016.1 succinate dehydrogenase cytochrome b subunit [Nitrospinaceae bacterium]MBT3823000.1 succinate dehydrogenase cytochrome b subunit [Nitrospinaceae bacterium]MBT4094605.1 succinate dehydrogenase cytochrome b subunit [Nitrospinaceae bacterium]MBT4428929.1 succinate dehydrogenase cytochrome b subunit [Nitrospinaceae bacterium]